MTTFTISEDRLHSSLGPVALFTSNEKATPILMTVQLSVSLRDVHFTATDRFTAARADAQTLNVDSEGGVTDVLLSSADVKQILATFKKLPTGSIVTFDVAPGRVVVSVEDGASLTLRPVDGDFPRLERLFVNALSDSLSATATGAQRLNPTNLERIAKAAKMIRTIERGAVTPVVELHGTQNKPVLFALGDDALAMVMPMRMPGGDDGLNVFTEWRARLDAVAASS